MRVQDQIGEAGRIATRRVGRVASNNRPAPDQAIRSRVCIAAPATAGRIGDRPRHREQRPGGSGWDTVVRTDVNEANIQTNLKQRLADVATRRSTASFPGARQRQKRRPLTGFSGSERDENTRQCSRLTCSCLRQFSGTAGAGFDRCGRCQMVHFFNNAMIQE